MLQSSDLKRGLGSFTFIKDEVAVNKGVRLKLQRAVSATVSVTDPFGKPLKDAKVQMRVTPRPDDAWYTLGATDARGRLKTNRLYQGGVYTLRASRAGYKTGDTGGLPRVGSKSWLNRIEITLERDNAKT